MAWTQANLDAVEAAILELSLGKRVVQTDIGGKTREFQRTQLDELKALRSDMQAELELVPLRTYAKNGGPF
jgi:hypothetical protein